ncbi:tyrosine-type recombinase/integrase [Natranaeroarchaeum aerophilus]|uniref:Tyrosine-type recombinase/integrase n=1 Tax=Natranaeroarchaeum aerophilus TaxID=2917711 RepID=A0AAE3FRC2_9EURY|nr:tyrosine-type recombinase/integrase [Natranaeroarchaeum aerophilus]MCL9813923.1 tyrosine-type recombinase/integrase [Natranaeroarchaeum aerophilus]
MSRTTTTDESVDDPVAYFVQDVGYHGKTERTQTAYERVLRQFEAFLAEGTARAQNGVSVDEATHRDCMEWVHSLRTDHAGSTVATYASYLHRFYGYMTQVGVLDANPMTLVVDQIEESIDTDPARREISLEEMQGFVQGITHPLDRAIIVTLLKTGLRVGELCNLDVRDVNIATDDLAAEMDARPQLSGQMNTIYVSPEPSRGERLNGEERTASNKRKRQTVVPVDEELESVLVEWLAIRPDPVSDADPLFVSTGDSWGHRLSTDMAHTIVTEHAEVRGWYRSGGGAAENVTPHYFRHFFTTHLRSETGDRGIVKYLRGDVAEDVIDTYTHNWGDRVRETYEASIYSLF